MVQRVLWLTIISIPCFAIDSSMEVSSILEGMGNRLQNDVRKLRAELSALHWLHPKRVRLNRRLKELQSRIMTFDQDVLKRQ